MANADEERFRKKLTSSGSRVEEILFGGEPFFVRHCRCAECTVAKRMPCMASSENRGFKHGSLYLHNLHSQITYQEQTLGPPVNQAPVEADNEVCCSSTSCLVLTGNHRYRPQRSTWGFFLVTWCLGQSLQLRKPDARLIQWSTLRAGKKNVPLPPPPPVQDRITLGADSECICHPPKSVQDLAPRRVRVASRRLPQATEGSKLWTDETLAVTWSSWGGAGRVEPSPSRTSE